MIIRFIVTLVAVTAFVGFGNADRGQAQSTPTSQAATLAAVQRGVSLSTLAAQGNPYVHVERVQLSPADCARLLAGVPAAQAAQVQAQQCSMLHYSFGANHLPVPARMPGAPGASAGTGSSGCCGYWYWWWWDDLCNGISCSIWDFHLNEDGVADGNNVYQWHTNCTASGLGSTVTWCGYLFNGGGAPYYGMEFGVNGSVCIGIGPATYCYGHGMRRWIDDWGDPTTVYNW
jgi:hypothetical protein